MLQRATARQARALGAHCGIAASAGDAARSEPVLCTRTKRHNRKAGSPLQPILHREGKGHRARAGRHHHRRRGALPGCRGERLRPRHDKRHCAGNAHSLRLRRAASRGRRVVGGLHAHAVAQHLFQRRRSAVLLQEIAEGLLGKLLHRLHAVEGELMQRVPRLCVELDSPAHRAWRSRSASALGLAFGRRGACAAARLVGAAFALRLPPLIAPRCCAARHPSG